MAPRSTPAFIGAILAAPVTRYLVLLALACPFALSAVFKLGAWPGAVREAAALVPQAPVLVASATIAVQLLGSVLLFSRRMCWLGAGMLAVFTAIATLAAHAFWLSDGAERAHQLATFLEHIAIIGGFAAAAILVDGRTNAT